MFASKFHWTPDQVDAAPASLSDWMLALEGLMARISEENQNNG